MPAQALRDTLPSLLLRTGLGAGMLLLLSCSQALRVLKPTPSPPDPAPGAEETAAPAAPIPPFEPPPPIPHFEPPPLELPPIPDWEPRPPERAMRDTGLFNLLGLRVKRRPQGIKDSVRILLLDGRRSLAVSSAGPVVLLGEEARGLRQLGRLQGDFRVAREGGRWAVASAEHGEAGGDAPLRLRPGGRGNLLRLDGKSYRGEVRLVPSGGGFDVVNHLPVEDYLRGVLPVEMGRRDLELVEALKAQAVVARTYTYKRMLRSGRRHFDLYGDIRDQVYGGANREYPLSDHAVRETAHQAVVHADTLAHCFYYSTCSGKTASYHEVWRGGRVPYLISLPDVDGEGKSFCAASSYMRWEESWDLDDLAAALPANLRAAGVRNFPRFARLEDVKVVSRTSSGRVALMQIHTDKGVITVRGDKTRWALKPRSRAYGILPSAWFSLEKRGKRLHARGRAFGHGIGLCQMGAMGRARAGQDFIEIIRSYYRDVEIAELR